MQYVFSIIIPIYNSEKFLRTSINSIVKQKIKNIEILLINDCSSDKSLKICNIYKKKYKFIKVINNKKNVGVGNCRNIGIKAALGKYLIFLDSDDSLMTKSITYLNKYINYKIEQDVTIVKYKKKTFPYTNEKLIKDNFNKKNPNDLIKYILNNRTPFSDCWFIVINREFLIRNKIYFSNSRFGESEIFVSKVLFYMKKFGFFRKNFYHKKDRLNSLTGSSDYKTTNSSLINLIEFDLFLKNTSSIGVKKKLLKKYFDGIFGVFTALLILRNNNEIYKLSKLFKRKKNKKIELIKMPEKINLKKIIKKYGDYYGLNKYKNIIMKNKFKKLKKQNFSKKKIYLYCRSQYTEATFKILKDNNHKIQGVVDDNPGFKNSKFLSFKTINSKEFFRFCKNKIKDIVVIITHQKINTLKKISKNLIKNGILKKNIYFISY